MKVRFAPQGKSPPQELEIEKERKIKNNGGVVYAPSAKQGIAPNNFFLHNNEKFNVFPLFLNPMYYKGKLYE